jgi:acetoin utilization deacetylase AcuC-like enzyme
MLQRSVKVLAWAKTLVYHFESEGHDDASYVSAFNWIILPILRQFNPDVVFVCAGFDAAVGDKNLKRIFK